jgi:hypothetical protein
MILELKVYLILVLWIVLNLLRQLFFLLGSFFLKGLPKFSYGFNKEENGGFGLYFFFIINYI